MRKFMRKCLKRLIFRPFRGCVEHRAFLHRCENPYHKQLCPEGRRKMVDRHQAHQDGGSGERAAAGSPHEAHQEVRAAPQRQPGIPGVLKPEE